MKGRITSIVLALLLVLCLTGCGNIVTDELINDAFDQVGNAIESIENSLATESENAPASPIQPDTPPSSSASSDNWGQSTVFTDGTTLSVTFIDVGQGDSALLESDGEYMLIDGGESDQSNTIYTVLKNRGIDHLDVMVATHGHSDHVGGLSGALNYATVGTAYCSVTEYDSKAFNNVVKYLDKQGVSLTVPSPGDTFMLGKATVTILGPVKEYDEPNDTSIVLRVDFGNTSFLFTGDMEEAAEKDLIASGANLDADVLKVGHHSSYTSTCYQFLREVMPEYAVISCGLDNSYGHPHDVTLSKLRDVDATVYRTDLQGDITVVSDGHTLTWSTNKSADAAQLNPTIGEGSGQWGTDTSDSPAEPTGNEEPEQSPVGMNYILNTNSKKFHYPACGSVETMSEKNKESFTGTREELIAKGYSPCGICDP